MRAAEPADGHEKADVVPIDRSAPSHRAAPVYAQRQDEGDLTGTFELDLDVRSWSSQLFQWLFIFAVVGAFIGGVKLWSASEGAAIAELAAGPAPASAATASPATGDGVPVAANGGATQLPPASTGVDGPEQVTGVDGGQAVDGTAASNGSTATERVAGDTAASPGQPVAADLDAPTVRAPADVPYPRKVYDVAPQVPDGSTLQRGIAVLSLLIDTRGNVVDVDLLRSLNPALDAAAVAAARQWRFEPTLRDGRPVAVRSNFTVRFGY